MQSEGLQNKIKELGLSEENIFKMAIPMVPMDGIRSKRKRMIFRKYSDFYMQKLNVFDEAGRNHGPKPITHLLVEVSFTKESPRMLLSLKKWGLIDKNSDQKDPYFESQIYPEAHREGFREGGEYFYFVVNQVEYEENFRTAVL